MNFDDFFQNNLTINNKTVKTVKTVQIVNFFEKEKKRTIRTFSRSECLTLTDRFHNYIEEIKSEFVYAR